jgi:hypothetical protein
MRGIQETKGKETNSCDLTGCDNFVEWAALKPAKSLLVSGISKPKA